MMPRTLAMDRCIEAFRPGERLFVAGAAGEPVALLQAISDRQDIDLHITTSLVPGINGFAPERFGPGVRFAGLFMQPSLGEAHRAGRFQWLPLPYSGFVKHIRERLEIDTCVVQVSPPDGNGRCSLGPSVEFIPQVAKKCARLIGLINPNVPRTALAFSLPVEAFAFLVEANAPLTIYEIGAIDSVSDVIAQRVAGFVEDGAAVQIGLGKVPNRLFERLHDRRGLHIHSGMLPDAVIGLAAAGAIDRARPITTCNVVGQRPLYDWLRDRDDVAVVGCEHSHDPVRLASLPRLVAVNSALEVDLSGQCNLEYANGRAVSGPGGAPDFARGARQSPGGISIIALPSTYAGGRQSRIVPRISAPGIVSLSRSDVDVLVTEQGIADLRGCSVIERAERIASVAAPSFRAELDDAFKDMVRSTS